MPDYIWSTWNDCGTTSSSSTTTWIKWTADSTTSASVTNDCTWRGWMTTGTGDAAVAYTQAYTINPESAEERERRLAAREEEKKRREVAEKSATELLQRWLDEEQRKQHADEKKFHVVGSDGNRYEVDCTKRQHNVYELDANGKRVREYCIYQTGDTPLADNHLGQKLLLEADAERFKQIANARRLA